MENNKQVDDIVKMLDNLMMDGGGHVNVDIKDAQAASPTVQTMNSNECSGQNMACKVPTLHVGIDDQLE